MSAAATATELMAIVKNIGMREKTVILRASPIQDQIRCCSDQRNTWQMFRGHTELGDMLTGLHGPPWVKRQLVHAGGQTGGRRVQEIETC